MAIVLEVYRLDSPMSLENIQNIAKRPDISFIDYTLKIGNT